jgi:hypothetical protein
VDPPVAENLATPFNQNPASRRSERIDQALQQAKLAALSANSNNKL